MSLDAGLFGMPFCSVLMSERGSLTGCDGFAYGLLGGCSRVTWLRAEARSAVFDAFAVGLETPLFELCDA